MAVTNYIGMNPTGVKISGRYATLFAGCFAGMIAFASFEGSYYPRFGHYTLEPKGYHFRPVQELKVPRAH